jgi:DNA-binding beta-propeller fold protein YncE
VIDCEQNSVVTVVEVDSEPVGMAWNPIDRRMYVANREGHSVSIIRDSLRVGVESWPQASGHKPVATLLRGVLYLPRDMTEIRSGISDRVPRPVLLDVSGRKVLDLRPGANDVSRLSPGVYFVKAVGRKPSAVSGYPSSVTKVVITR